MKKLLITGFEPFGEELINPSWEAVNLLDSQIGEYQITKLLLPVVFEKAYKKTVKKANELCLNVILWIGQAGGRNAITPELVAINLRHASIPDNNGNKPQDQPIILGGENAYFSNIPVRKIVDAISSKQIPAKVSYSAGAYVCNDLLYSLLNNFKNSETLVGFIHLPYCTEQNKQPCMPLDDMVKGLTIAIENI